ncbi:MAG: endonuclease [Hyphomicrobium sp.]
MALTFENDLVAGEPREFGTTCDFEVDTDNDIAEPPPDARGDVARANFYMHQEYQLPIEAALLSVLQGWNLADPPTTVERQRNDAIEALEDTRNPFIDQPGLGNGL